LWWWFSWKYAPLHLQSCLETSVFDQQALIRSHSDQQTHLTNFILHSKNKTIADDDLESPLSFQTWNENKITYAQDLPTSFLHILQTNVQWFHNHEKARATYVILMFTPPKMEHYVLSVSPEWYRWLRGMQGEHFDGWYFQWSRSHKVRTTNIATIATTTAMIMVAEPKMHLDYPRWR
jgi:hypothetical protein